MSEIFKPLLKYQQNNNEPTKRNNQTIFFNSTQKGSLFLQTINSFY